VFLVPCLACGSLLEQGALRCRFCSVTLRPTLLKGEGTGRPRAAVPTPLPEPRRSRGPESWLEQLVAISRDRFVGP